MRVLVACELSGVVRDAFLARGHDAISCDLLPSEREGPHIQGDIRTVDLSEYDLMIAHPPCTHLTVSGARWFKDKQREQTEALDFVRYLLDAPVEKIALENPVGVISSRIRKPDQIYQPYYFGDSISKKTCLWLKGLPPLVPTSIVDPGERVTYASGRSVPKWCADSWSLPPEERARVRSYTPRGVAAAMAEQWG